MDQHTDSPKPAPCLTCKTNISIECCQQYDYSFLVYCSGCYDAELVGDPPEYRSGCMTATGGTPAEAIAEWNDRIELERD